MKIVFDIDNTLIDCNDKPQHNIIDLFHCFEKLGWEMYIHSGGGTDYAQKWMDKLGLNAKIVEKGNNINYDIAVDDNNDEYDWTKNIRAKVFITIK